MEVEATLALRETGKNPIFLKLYFKKTCVPSFNSRFTSMISNTGILGHFNLS
jgi:hypothetical protein